MQKTFDKKYNKVFDACHQALEAMDIEVSSSNKSKGIIHASTGSSLLSWGEEIEIKIDDISEYKTRVTVKSETQAQLISWGKNDRNKEEIISKISKYLSK